MTTEAIISQLILMFTPLFLGILLAIASRIANQEDEEENKK